MKIRKLTVVLIALAIVLMGYRVFIFDNAVSESPIIFEFKKIRQDIVEAKSKNKDTVALEDRQYKLVDAVLQNVIEGKTLERDIRGWFGEPDVQLDGANDLNHIDGWSIYIKTDFDTAPTNNQFVYGYRFYSFDLPASSHGGSIDRAVIFLINKKTKRVDHISKQRFYFK